MVSGAVLTIDALTMLRAMIRDGVTISAISVPPAPVCGRRRAIKLAKDLRQRSRHRPEHVQLDNFRYDDRCLDQRLVGEFRINEAKVLEEPSMTLGDRSALMAIGHRYATEHDHELFLSIRLR